MRILGWLAIALAAACGNSQTSRGSSVSTAAGTEFRALVYGRALAERFGLSVKEAIVSEPGLLGMALHVTTDSSANAGCSLYLYLDESLGIAYPPRSSGRLDDLNPETGPLFFAGKLNDNDSEARNTRVFEMPVLFLSRAYAKQQKRGVTDGGPSSSFYRELLPGLNVIVYSVACAGLDPSNGPADVWLLRTGHEGEELNPLGPSTDSAVNLEVPMSLLQVASERTREAAKRPINLKPPPPPIYSVPAAPR